MNRTSSLDKVALLLTMFSICLCWANTLPAQSGLSSISGKVRDPQGMAIPGATVTLKDTERNQIRVQSTNMSGDYIFSALMPGIYQIEVEARGFIKLTVDEVPAPVDQSIQLDHELEIGTIDIAITVTAEEEIRLNTQDSTIGNNFRTSQITQFPLESRNVVTLLSVQPGVTPDGYVSGSRADQANVTLDGVDINEQQTGMNVAQDLAFDRDEAFASVLRVTPDSVQEFRVTVSNPNAAQGRSSGGQVSMVTKSGTNRFHGSLYEFHRNTATSANTFFNNLTIDPNTGKSIPRPKLIRNLFGGSIGGPIKKDRAFFFFTYEGRRDASEKSVTRFVPLASLGQGQIRFPNESGEVVTLNANDLNELYPDAGINRAALDVLVEAAERYPANDFTVGDSSSDLLLNVGGYRFNAPAPLSLNTYIAKLDFNLASDGRHSLFLRGNFQDDHIGGAPQFPDTEAPTLWRHPRGFAAGHTWSISPNKINSFRYGLTREAFTNLGDLARNDIGFRFVYIPHRSPTLRTLNRTTPVHNFVDDFSWVKGNHNLQMGVNIRLIGNKRLSFSRSYDSAITNPSFYEFSGAVLEDPILNDGYTIAPGYSSSVQSAVAAVIGRYSQYTARFNFDINGNLLATGAGVPREFATQEYDWYIQDTWKVRSDLTLTMGLRYSIGRPIYEVKGYEVKPTVSLGDFFERRKSSAMEGIAINESIQLDLAGPANDRPGSYSWDNNNFQPRVSIAWSPQFKNKFLHRIFGDAGASVIRGGFAITNDHIGQQLAVTFDNNNTLGFSTSQTIPANTYNVTDRPAPLFTGFNQDIRTLPNITIPDSLTFPVMQPANEEQRIEFSLDDTIKTPINYSWNVSFGRQLPAGLFVEASYIGRSARNLLAQRDVMQLNNLVDPASGMDWYGAMGALIDLRSQNIEIDAVGEIAYFENLFPDMGSYFIPGTSTKNFYWLIAREAVGGYNFTDYTYIQAILDSDDWFPGNENKFFHPQYAALATWSTVASSDYHAGSLSIRQRFKEELNWGFNYTFSKSMDNASGLQKNGAFGNDFGNGFILNSLRPEDARSYSDFDIRHIVNGYLNWQFPIGRGKLLLSQIGPIGDAILGGWQLSTIYRWNSGLPAPNIFDANVWATNWNVQSYAVRTRPIESSPTRGGANAPNLFSDPVYAYQSFRNPRAGETGDRNIIRLPGFVTLDMGLGKSFNMPWYESHRLQFRWEVFNVTNTQRLRVSSDGYSRESFGIGQDPELGTPAPTFGNFDSIQGTPRVMQFALRYTW